MRKSRSSRNNRVRTEHYRFTGKAIEDLDGMDSALKCFARIEITVIDQ